MTPKNTGKNMPSAQLLRKIAAASSTPFDGTATFDRLIDMMLDRAHLGFNNIIVGPSDISSVIIERLINMGYSVATERCRNGKTMISWR